jgi:hypothetical protein
MAKKEAEIKEDQFYKVKMDGNGRIYQGVGLEGTEFEGDQLLPGETYELPGKAAQAVVDTGRGSVVSAVRGRKVEAEEKPEADKS